MSKNWEETILLILIVIVSQQQRDEHTPAFRLSEHFFRQAVLASILCTASLAPYHQASFLCNFVLRCKHTDTVKIQLFYSKKKSIFSEHLILGTGKTWKKRGEISARGGL